MSTQEATGVLAERRRRVRWAAIEEPVLYAGAAVSYVTIGVFVTPVMLFWGVGFAWLLFWVCGLPAIVHRLLR
jgi:hypothetical protein